MMEKLKKIFIFITLLIIISLMFLITIKPYKKGYLIKDSKSNDKINLKSGDKYKSLITLKDDYVEGLEIYNDYMRYYFHYTSQPFVMTIRVYLENKIFYEEQFTKIEQGSAMILFDNPIKDYKNKEIKIEFEVEEAKEDIIFLLNKSGEVRADQISKEIDFTNLLYLFGLFIIIIVIITTKYINYKKIRLLYNKAFKLLYLPLYFTISLAFACLCLYMIYKAHYLNHIPITLLLTEIILLFIIIFINTYIIKFNDRKIEKWFLALAIPISCLFCILLLPNDGQDGCRHYGVIYGYATGQNVSEGKVEIPNVIHIHKNDITSLEQFFQTIKSDYDYKTTRTIKIAKYSMLNYIFSIPTIYVAKLLNLHPYIGWYLAKIVNMLMTIIISYFIIKRVPKFKKIFLAYILTPYFIYQYVCLPTDLIINLATLILLAIGLDYYFNPRKIKAIDWIFTIINAILMNIAKPIYYPLLLVILLLMRKSIKINKKTNIMYLLVCLVLPIFLYFLTQNMFTNGNNELLIDSINANSIGVSYLIKHPIQGILGLIKNLLYEGDEYILNLIGWKFNWAGGNVPYLLPVLYLFILLYASFIPNINEKRKIDKLSISITALIAFAVLCLLILFWMYCEVQSDIFIDKMYGLNGRYCIPIFIFFLICLGNINILNNKKENIDKYDKFLIYSICFISYLYIFNFIQFLFI